MVRNLFPSAGCYWLAAWGALKPAAGCGVYCEVRQANSPPPGGPELRPGLEKQRENISEHLDPLSLTVDYITERFSHLRECERWVVLSEVNMTECVETDSKCE